jgi:hypothetical protein
MDGRKLLILVFAGVFLLKTTLLVSGSTVPPGWVDTSYHVSTSRDIAEGDLDSLVHPWWHIDGNSQEVDGVSVIDRNSETFFYPPFLHVFTALFMLFLPAGLATISSVSLLYSLSVLATYLLSRSYRIKGKASLIGSTFAGASPLLVASQVRGFWSFAVAFNFLIISYACFRFYSTENNNRYALGYIASGLLAILTHWTFGLPVVALPSIHLLISRNWRSLMEWNWEYLPVIGVLGASAPFYLMFLLTSSLSSYIGTSFSELIYGPALVVFVVGILWTERKKSTVTILSAIITVTMAAFYLFQVEILFADMLQFATPVIAGFYLAEFVEDNLEPEPDNLQLLACLGLILLSAGGSVQALDDSTRAVSDEEFQALVDARDRDFNNTILYNQDIGTWITLGSKDSRIVNPYIEYNSSRLDNNPEFRELQLTGASP